MNDRLNHILGLNIPEKLYSANVFLYGAGNTGKIIGKLLFDRKVKILAYIDDDPVKWGEFIEDVPIISFDCFAEEWKNQEVAVIITSIYAKSLLDKLYQNSKCYIYDMFDYYSDKYDAASQISKQCSRDDIEVFKNRCEQLFPLMADEESIDVMRALYGYLCNKDLSELFRICSSYEQYFIPEVVRVIKEPINIVDAGAYEGELNRTLSKLNIPVNKWFCFEADTINYNSMCGKAFKTQFQNQQICEKKALWNKDGNVYFLHNEGGAASKIVDYKTEYSIETITLDTYFKEDKIDFLKMDIEGAEIPALEGGLKVIKRDRPILAISIYHSLNDFYKIPEMLTSALTNYTWYIRHHSLVFCETVLYGVPNEM